MTYALRSQKESALIFQVENKTNQAQEEKVAAIGSGMLVQEVVLPLHDEKVPISKLTPLLAAQGKVSVRSLSFDQKQWLVGHIGSQAFQALQSRLTPLLIAEELIKAQSFTADFLGESASLDQKTATRVASFRS